MHSARFYLLGLFAAGVAILSVTSPGCSCSQGREPDLPPTEARTPDASSPAVPPTDATPDPAPTTAAELEPEVVPEEPIASAKTNAAQSPEDQATPPSDKSPTTPMSPVQTDDQPATTGGLVPKSNLQDARKIGTECLAAAREATRDGKHEQAFKQATQGWQAVAPFSSDAKCRELSKALAKQLELAAKKLNSGVSIDSSKTLVVE